MCEPAIHVLRSVFTRLVQQNLFASVVTLRVLFVLCVCGGGGGGVCVCVRDNDWY